MNDYKPPLPPSPADRFEENLGRMLKGAFGSSKAAPEMVVSPDFEGRISRAVLEEVRRVRRQRHRRTVWWAAALAAAMLMIVFGSWQWHLSYSGTQGRLRSLYGLVSVKENGKAVELAQVGPSRSEQWMDVQDKSWIDTRWGSQAEIMLADNSRLLTRPQTLIQLESGRQGEKVILKEGWMSVSAAKQLPGKMLTIDTPGAKVSVLGTKFDVHIVQKPDGIKQTRVSVASGQVALESAGRKILLPPNTEGIADAVSPPQRRCQTPEINELVRLMDLNRTLAAKAEIKAGAPSIVQFQGNGSATVWLVVHSTSLAGRGPSAWSLKLRETAAAVEAFSWAGSPLDVKVRGQQIEIQSAGGLSEPDQTGRIILKLSGVKGLFTGQGQGIFAFIRAVDDPSVLSLFQFLLPESARIEEIQPPPIEKTKSLSRQSLTLVTHVHPLEMVADGE